jgi:hypothetical protein
MKRMTMTALIAATAAAGLSVASPAAAQSAADQQRLDTAQQRFDREYQLYREEVDRFRSSSRRGGGYDRGGAGYDNRARGYEEDSAYYDPTRDYRDGPGYRERVLSSDDRVYRGTDGRYYCKRSDGTTGLILGAAGGGVLGNVIDGGRSRTVGTLLGAALGAVAGRAVDQNNQQLRCR